jgi:hypothetical protein
MSQVILNRDILVDISNVIEDLNEIADEVNLSEDQLNKFLEIQPIIDRVLDQIDEVLR